MFRLWVLVRFILQSADEAAAIKNVNDNFVQTILWFNDTLYLIFWWIMPLPYTRPPYRKPVMEAIKINHDTFPISRAILRFFIMQEWVRRGPFSINSHKLMTDKIFTNSKYLRFKISLYLHPQTNVLICHIWTQWLAWYN